MLQRPAGGVQGGGQEGGGLRGPLWRRPRQKAGLASPCPRCPGSLREEGRSASPQGGPGPASAGKMHSRCDPSPKLQCHHQGPGPTAFPSDGRASRDLSAHPPVCSLLHGKEDTSGSICGHHTVALALQGPQLPALASFLPPLSPPLSPVFLPQPHWPPCQASNTSATFPPRDLCTGRSTLQIAAGLAAPPQPFASVSVSPVQWGPWRQPFQLAPTCLSLSPARLLGASLRH